MVECNFCDREFDDKTDLHIHWGEEHEDELNSHQKEKVKKAKRKKNEQKEKKNAKRKKMAGMGLAGVGALVVIALLGSQLIDMSPGSGNSAELSTEGEPVIGNPDANITIVEFGDFQCPACNQFEQQTYPQLVNNYIESGQVKMVWKDFPLTEIGHDWARPAAMAAECVYREGGDEAFFGVKEQIFNNQDALNAGNVQSEIISYAEEENVSADTVQSCLNNGNPGQEVDQDKSDGRSAGVSGTPTVFVNGQEINARYASIKAAIEQQLRK